MFILLVFWYMSFPPSYWRLLLFAKRLFRAMIVFPFCATLTLSFLSCFHFFPRPRTSSYITYLASTEYDSELVEEFFFQLVHTLYARLQNASVTTTCTYRLKRTVMPTNVDEVTSQIWVLRCLFSYIPVFRSWLIMDEKYELVWSNNYAVTSVGIGNRRCSMTFMPVHTISFNHFFPMLFPPV